MSLMHTLDAQVCAHTVLPADAQSALMSAASTPVPRDDPRARQRAIDQAIERIQLKYPHLFQKEFT